MSLKSIIYISIIMLAFGLQAQDMQKGFTFLETGKYQDAEVFFQTMLKDYPDNKTARLCYGRAVGLNGKPEQAINIFTDLLKDNPNDFEVKLNYAESLLWNNNFIKAKSYYRNLITENDQNFSALLGYANSLSNLKQYEDALIYVDKALAIQPGNPNALTSKKYIYLGYAYQNQLTQNYKDAEALLTRNLELFNDDKETLLNLANLYLINNDLDSAKSIYNRLAKQEEHEILALNGLALVAHLNGKEKSALYLSTQAYKSITKNTDTIVAQQTTQRYTQALIWNKKFKPADMLITQLMETKANENWVLALRATLNIYKSNFKQSLIDYNRILENDSTSFDGNLGKANALKALGRYDEAYTWAENTLKIYKNQKDALNFLNQMNSGFSPSLESKAAHTFDNGDNKAFSFINNVVYPLSTKFSLLGNYRYRSTNNTVTGNNATSNNLSFGMSYRLLPSILFNGSAGTASAKTESTEYTQLLTHVSFNIKSFKLQTLDIGYKRQVESFNADLLERELVQNNFYANYNLNTNFNFGWYTQYMYTSQNDNNTRNLVFTSLYYNLLSKPVLKVGLNYQYITFKDQIPTVYFSPEKFNAGEVFINLVKDEAIAKPKAWFYNLTAAYGFQFIEDDTKQNAYRFQGMFGYKFSDRSLLNVYGIHSNIASATAAGFSFTEIGLRFKWHFLTKLQFRIDQN